jgi:hypothetical protein
MCKRKKTTIKNLKAFCIKCNKCFSSNFALRRHNTIHQNLRQWQCTNCPLSFRNKFNLERHFNILHAKKNIHSYVCPKCPDKGYCKSAFSTKWNLQRHIKNYHVDRSEKWRKKNEERINHLLTESNIIYERESCIQILPCFSKEKECINKNYARLDFVINGCIILSVDEHQHKTYGDFAEIERMLNVYSALVLCNITKIKWIRYNPDSYSVNGQKRYKTTQERENILLQVLKENKKQTSNLEIIFMFYTTNNSKVWLEDSMPETLQACVSRRII